MRCVRKDALSYFIICHSHYVRIYERVAMRCDENRSCTYFDPSHWKTHGNSFDNLIYLSKGVSQHNQYTGIYRFSHEIDTYCDTLIENRFSDMHVENFVTLGNPRIFPLSSVWSCVLNICSNVSQCLGSECNKYWLINDQWPPYVLTRSCCYLKSLGSLEEWRNSFKLVIIPLILHCSYPCFHVFLT